MAAILTEIADNPGQVCLHHLMIRIRGPEALGIKLLERLARKFEPAAASFGSWLRHVHRAKISPFSDLEQVPDSKPQFLEPVFHFLEMKVERAEFFQFARLEMFRHGGIGL